LSTPTLLVDGTARITLEWKEKIKVLVFIGDGENRRRNVISLNQPRGISAKWLQMGLEPMPVPIRNVLERRGRGNP